MTTSFLSKRLLIPASLLAFLLTTSNLCGQKPVLPCIAEWAKTANSSTPKSDVEAFLHGPHSRARLFLEKAPPTLKTSTKSATADAFFRQGLTLLHNFWNREAERSFREALQHDPAFALAYWGLAQANEQRPARYRHFIDQARHQARPGLEQDLIEAYRPKNLEARITKIETLILDHPDQPFLKTLLARHLVLADQRSQTPLPSPLAASYLLGTNTPLYRNLLFLESHPKKALNTPNPAIPDTHRYRAETHLRLQQPEQAVLHLQKAVQQDLNLLSQRLKHPVIVQSLASNYATLIDTLSQLGRFDEAISAARAMAALPRHAPDHPDYHHLSTSTHLQSINTLGRIFLTHQQIPRLQNLAQQLPLATPPDLQEKKALAAWKTHPIPIEIPPGYPAKVPKNFTPWTLAATLLNQAPSADNRRKIAARLQRALSQADFQPTSFLDTHTAIQLAHHAGDQRRAQFLIDRSFLRRLAQSSSALDLATPLRDLLPGDQKTAPAPAFSPPIAKQPLAPYWTLPDGLGNMISLSDYQGKPVLVIFYLGSGCLHCIEQLTAFYPRAAAYQAAGISIVAIATDSPEKLGETLKAERKSNATFPFTILSDHQFTHFQAYRAFDEFENRPLHGTFLISPTGRLLWSTIGNEPFMEPTWLLTEAKRLLQNRTPQPLNLPEPPPAQAAPTQ